MTAADRDLVEAIFAELAAIDPARSCDRRAEAAALVGAPARRRVRLGRLTHRLRPPSAPADGGPPHGPGAFDWDGARPHCRAAWLRGLFLAHGSLSLAGGRTHLELVVPVDAASELARRLDSLDLPAGWRVRRGKGVVTWKSSERVGTFLRLLGAGAALLELEARSVARALRGDLNRVLNAESANVGRAVLAAGRQLAAIELLEADGRLGEQPLVVRAVAAARRETPEATFTELAERMGVHRSAVQRALDRIERLALHDDAGIGRRGSGRHRRTGRTARPTRPARLA